MFRKKLEIIMTHKLKNQEWVQLVGIKRLLMTAATHFLLEHLDSLKRCQKKQ